MIRTVCWILCFLFITAWFPAVSQSHYFKHYLADDGLAHNTVEALMQDSHGLLWIGTKSGVNRFDGYRFRNYNNEHNSLGAIGNNVILSFAEDRQHMIWIGTERGLFTFDPSKETFTEAHFLANASFNNLLVDSTGNIWFLAGSDVCYFDLLKNKYITTKMSASCMTFDRQGNLWMGERQGIIIRYNAREQKRDSFRVISQSLPQNMQKISKLVVTRKGELMVGTVKQGLKKFDPMTQRLETILQYNTDRTEIFVRDIVLNDDDQEYWIATESGIYIYNYVSGAISHLHKRIGDNYALSDNPVYALCRDRTGSMWAGTFFGGLNYYSKENAEFEKYYPLIDNNSISGNAVREITGDNNHNLWIGTEDAGINKYSLLTKQFTHYTAKGSSSTISYPNIHGLLAVGRTLFIGPYQHGLEIMDIPSGRITERFRLFGEKGAMNSDFVMCIYKTRDSTLFIGSTGVAAGLYTYDPRTKSFTKSKRIPADSYVFTILEDHAGTIWTGSLQKGTFYFNPRSDEQGNIRFGEAEPNKKIIDNPIQGITEDSDHNLWFMTEGGGLLKLGADRKTIKKFTVRDGLPSNYLFRALEDEHHNLWISSLKGLVCFNTRTLQVRTFTQENGLITDQFNYNSAYKDENGRMYFGSVRGMIGFEPDSVIKARAAPPLYITGFQINNNEVVPGGDHSPLNNSVMYIDSIVLKHDQSSFSIEFAALNYASPKETRYRFRMKGLDKEWTFLKTNRKAYFTDLSAGDYTFTVVAESNVGRWQISARPLFIRVLPPFWKSTLAYVGYCLLLIGAIWAFIYFDKLRLERKNQTKLQLFEHEKIKEIYQAKIEFFTNIAHEIQTPLTLIIGPVTLLKKKLEHFSEAKRNFEMIAKNAHRLYELTTQLLDFRKTEIDGFSLNFVNADICMLLKEQVDNFQGQAETAGVELQLVVPREQFMAYIDREALTKIITNLLSNAIKYSGGSAQVELFAPHMNDTCFTIEVANDGPLIPNEVKIKIFEPFFRIKGNAKQGTGIGLALAKSLSELHNGTLILKTEKDKNIFQLRLPVHQKFEFKLDT